MKNLELASPSEMSASARAGEITAILAAAIVHTVVAEAPVPRLQFFWTQIWGKACVSNWSC